MRSATRALTMLALLTAATTLGTAPLGAQCTNLTGNPTPVPVPDVSLKTVMRAAGGGAFGDGNDKWKSPKGQFIASGPFDLTTTHSLHITLRRNGSGGPVMPQASAVGPSMTPMFLVRSSQIGLLVSSASYSSRRRGR